MRRSTSSDRTAAARCARCCGRRRCPLGSCPSLPCSDARATCQPAPQRHPDVSYTPTPYAPMPGGHPASQTAAHTTTHPRDRRCQARERRPHPSNQGSDELGPNRGNWEAAEGQSQKSNGESSATTTSTSSRAAANNCLAKIQERYGLAQDEAERQGQRLGTLRRRPLAELRTTLPRTVACQLNGGRSEANQPTIQGEHHAKRVRSSLRRLPRDSSSAPVAVMRDQQTVGSYVDDATITTQVKGQKFAENQTVSAMAIGVETLKGVVRLIPLCQVRRGARNGRASGTQRQRRAFGEERHRRAAAKSRCRRRPYSTGAAPTHNFRYKAFAARVAMVRRVKTFIVEDNPDHS